MAGFVGCQAQYFYCSFCLGGQCLAPKTATYSYAQRYGSFKKMKSINLILFGLVILMFSCCQNRHHDLQGDWYLDKIILSFNDSLCLHPFNYGDYYKYQLHNDTLIIPFKNNSENNIDFYKYLIVKTSDSIINLKGINPAIIQLDENGNEIPDWVWSYKRIKPKNNEQIKKIIYSSSGCFGRCPVLSIEISDDLKVKFNGYSYTKIKGYNEGLINIDLFEFLEQKFNNLLIDSIRTQYMEPATDLQYNALVVYFGEGKKLET